ncbi:hypothetical protein BpHYR1_008180 [Brachionus plicatilis]|uniref:Uncharacterized protein n=1 Tax=Brachionus plicatilis TaxID=10195 RepID=A0A3M7PR65_BRAPC|nr:hypothetical protein BpHYR1_008180 [Brachionus plicatilis]
MPFQNNDWLLKIIFILAITNTIDKNLESLEYELSAVEILPLHDKKIHPMFVQYGIPLIK